MPGVHGMKFIQNSVSIKHPPAWQRQQAAMCCKKALINFSSLLSRNTVAVVLDTGALKLMVFIWALTRFTHDVIQLNNIVVQFRVLNIFSLKYELAKTATWIF